MRNFVPGFFADFTDELFADQAAQCAYHSEDAVDRAVIKNVYSHAALYQLGRDIGLHVRKSEHEIGIQLEDAVNLCTGEGGYFRLFLACPRRPDSEA